MQQRYNMQYHLGQNDAEENCVWCPSQTPRSYCARPHADVCGRCQQEHSWKTTGHQEDEAARKPAVDVGNIEYCGLPANCLIGYHHSHPDYRQSQRSHKDKVLYDILAITGIPFSSELRSDGGQGEKYLLGIVVQPRNSNHKFTERETGERKVEGQEVVGWMMFISSSPEKLWQL